jgi:hypothetical protein
MIGFGCLQEPDEQMGVVDAQYVTHHAVVTLGSKNMGNATVEGSRSSVMARQKAEFDAFTARMRNAERAQQQQEAARHPAPPIATPKS